MKEVRHHQCIFQVGSQQRSERNFRIACERVRNGRIGKLQHIIVGLPTGPHGGPFPKVPVPAGLNWDYWLGQAPVMPYNGKNCHSNFRWWYPFSGVQFIGPDGWISLARGQLQASNEDLLRTPLPQSAVKLYHSGDHMGNFSDSMRSRKDPICDVEIGHRSITIAHLGVISIRMGQALQWNPEKEEFTGANAKEANQ